MNLVVDGLIFAHQEAGGISRIFRESLPRICEMEPEAHVTLFTEAETVASDLPRHRRITHRRLPRPDRWLRPSRAWRSVLPHVKDLVRRVALGTGEHQIWHSTYYTLPVRWKGARVVTVYDLIHERFAGEFFDTPEDERFRARKRECVETADAVICISETTRTDLLDYYRIAPERVHTVPLAHGECFAPVPGPEPVRTSPVERPYLLYVGGRRAYKDFDLLLRVYARWARAQPVDLVVVGGGAWTEAESDRLRELAVGAHVHQIAAASDTELRALYGNALGFVHPSRYEGFGLPVLEALACACPVVASRIPSTLEVAGDCAIYFEPGDEPALQDALDRLADGGAAELREPGLKRASGYSWVETARGMVEVYRRVMDPAIGAGKRPDMALCVKGTGADGGIGV